MSLRRRARRAGVQGVLGDDSGDNSACAIVTSTSFGLARFRILEKTARSERGGKTVTVGRCETFGEKVTKVERLILACRIFLYLNFNWALTSTQTTKQLRAGVGVEILKMAYTPDGSSTPEST